MRQAVYDHIQKKYHVKPEYLWRRYPDYAVFRHADNGKWFALAAGVRGEIAGVPDAEGVDVINLKVDDLFFRDLLIREEGIMPAYHMNKQHWITVRLEGDVPEDLLGTLIRMSYDLTAKK